MIPVLVSNKGYGLFWDNYSITNFAGNVSSNTRYSFSSEAGDLVDYYFFYGPTIDQVIANYRTHDGAGAAVSQVGLRPLPVEGPLSELLRADEPSRTAIATTTSPSTSSFRTGSTGARRCGARTSWTPSRYPDPGRHREPAARGPHPHDDLDLAALSDAVERRGDGGGRARQLQRLERDQRALPDDDVGRHLPLLRHVQRDGADARLPAVVRSPDREVRLGLDLGRQHRAAELSRRA